MLPEPIPKRIEALTQVVDKLLEQEPVLYRNAKPSSFPDVGGVYVISSSAGEFVRAGKTGQGYATLRDRLYRNHLMGNQGGNLRAQLVGSGQCRDMDDAKSWVRENCSVRFLEIIDSTERANIEHFILAVLKPRFCDDNKSMKGSPDGSSCK
jgi:hypothetical protein